MRPTSWWRRNACSSAPSSAALRVIELYTSQGCDSCPPADRWLAALPDDALGLPRALLVSKETTGPTGDDRTFWVTDSALSDAKLTEALAALGLVGHPLIALGGLKLVVLAGYVQADDGRLSAAPGALKGVIGAAPVY